MDTISKTTIIKVKGQESTSKEDFLVVEEPLEIRLSFKKNDTRHQKSISVTMRTPGDDEALALGFLFTEGILKSMSQVKGISALPVRQKKSPNNVIVIELTSGQEVNFRKLERHFYTASSCGVCGKTSIEAVRIQGQYELPDKMPQMNASIFHSLPELLLSRQSVFDCTGGLHAAALVDSSGNLVSVKEDVGRHNALDKLIGSFWQNDQLPLSNYAGLVSGRAGFELVQKLAVAGVPIMAAVGAPTSLAIQLAEEVGMTLIGFLRNSGFNIYTCPERIRM